MTRSEATPVRLPGCTSLTHFNSNHNKIMESGILLRPKNVLLLCTSRCNLRCGICGYGQSTGGMDLPHSLVKRLSSELTEAGVKTVYLSGGEPLLHQEFDALLATLLDSGLNVRLSTNGTLLTPERINVLRRLTDISISLDGPAEIHDQIRGVPGSFDRTVSGIRALRDCAPDTEICISLTIMPENVGVVNELIEFSRSIGVDTIGIQPPVTSFFRKTEQALLKTDPESSAKLANTFQTLGAMNQDVSANASYYYHLCTEYIVNGFRPSIPCRAGRDILTIFADGTIGPCWALPTTLNLRDMSYSHAVSNPAFLRAFENAAKGQCCGCLFYCFFFPET